MFKYSIKTALFFFMAFSLTLSFPSFSDAARKAALEDVVVVRDKGMKVSFVVRDAIKKDIKEAIESGIPTSFTFIVKINRKRGLWLDKNIGKWKFNHTVRYDNLKDEYEVYIEETGKKKIVKDFSEMVELMVTGKDVNLTPLPALREGEEYILRLKAKLDTVTLPFHLDYILLFVKLWNFETQWHIYEFTS